MEIKDQEERNEAVNAFLSKMNEYETRKEMAFKTGIPALTRLLVVAKNDTGQSITCRRVLLGLYNGHAYPFPLTELRGLDADLFDDCMAVITMDACGPIKEIHEFIKDGSTLFTQWAREIKK